MEKSNVTKNWFFEISESDNKPLPFIRNKRKNIQTNIRNESSELNRNSKDIKRVLR